jgi:hypothetical protein
MRDTENGGGGDQVAAIGAGVRPRDAGSEGVEVK